MPNQNQTPADVSPTLAAAILATGFRWTEEHDWKLANISGFLQHRHRDRVHTSTARRYANMYKAGSTPPSIGVCRDGMLIWGNQRTAGAEIAGWETLPAIVFDVDGKDADHDEFLKNSLLSLAVAENAPHGLPYNPEDRKHAAIALIGLGYTNNAVSKELGLSSSQVSGVRAEVEADKRLETLGATAAIEALPRGVKRVLAGPDARALNDDPFRRLVDLADAASLKGDEVREIAKTAKESGSDQGAITVIADAREGWEQRIAELASGGRERPTPVGKLRDVLSRLKNLCEAATSPDVYRDRTAGADDTIVMLDEGIGCLQRIRAQQEPTLFAVVTEANES